MIRKFIPRLTTAISIGIVVLLTFIVAPPTSAYLETPGFNIEQLPNYVFYENESIKIPVTVSVWFRQSESSAPSLDLSLIDERQHTVEKLAEFTPNDFSFEEILSMMRGTAKKDIEINLTQGNYGLKLYSPENKSEYIENIQVVPAGEPKTFRDEITGKIIPSEDAYVVSNEVLVYFDHTTSFSTERSLMSDILARTDGKIIGREGLGYQIEIPDTKNENGIKNTAKIIEEMNAPEITMIHWRRVASPHARLCSLVNREKIYPQIEDENMLRNTIIVSGILFIIILTLVIILGARIRRLFMTKTLRHKKTALIIYYIVSVMATILITIFVFGELVRACFAPLAGL